MTSFVDLNIHWHRTEVREREGQGAREGEAHLLTRGDVRVEQEEPTAKQTDTINYGQKRHTLHIPHFIVTVKSLNKFNWEYSAIWRHFTVVTHNSTVAAMCKTRFDIQKRCFLPAMCVYASVKFMLYYTTGLTKQTDRFFVPVTEGNKRVVPESGRLVCCLYRRWIYFIILCSSDENFKMFVRISVIYQSHKSKNLAK